MRYLDDLAESRETYATQLDKIVATAADEQRELSEAETRAVDELGKQVAIIDQQVRLFVDNDEKQRHFSDLMARASRSDRVAQRQKPTAQTETRQMDIGERFVSNPEYRSWAESGARGKSPSIDLPMLETRSPLLTTTWSNFVIPQQVAAPMPNYVFPLWDAFSKVNVSSGSISYPTYPAAVLNTAAVVQEGQVKPEANLSVTWTEKVIPMVAHWIEFSRQFAQDYPAIRDWIRDELLAGVLEKIETDAAAAVKATTATPVATGATLLESIRIAMANIQVAGGNPRILLLNPADAAALDVQVMGSTLTGPIVRPTYFGLTVVPSKDMAAGTAIVMDPRAATIYVRANAQVFLTDSDVSEATAAKSNFKRNILTLLAESRALAVLTRPGWAVPAQKKP